MKNVFSTSVFLVHKWDVLLVHHKRLKLWLPVGGELEPNERPLHGAIREVKEETGLELTLDNFPPSDVPGGMPGFLCYEEHDGGVKDGVERRHMNFALHAVVDSKDITLGEEHASSMWWNDSKLPVKTAPNVVWCLLEIQRLLALAAFNQQGDTHGPNNTP